MRKSLLIISLTAFCGAQIGYAQMRGSAALSSKAISSAAPTQNSIQTTQPFVNGLPSNLLNSTPMAGGCPAVLLEEDFQDQLIPASWINLDLDGLNDANGRPDNWYVGFDAQSTTPGDTNWAAFSSSWFTPAGTASNWLILDPVTICDPNVVLKWSSKPFEGPAYLDGYKVLLSPTGGSQLANFTVELADFAEGDANGNLTAGIVHTAFNGNNGLFQDWSATLGSYFGQTVRIAFVHESIDDNIIMIDNIFIGLDQSYDLAASGAYIGTEYLLTPETQVRPLFFSVDVTNVSLSAVTATSVNFDVNDGTQSVFNQTENGGPLAAGATQSVTSSVSFTPPATVADYELTVTVSGTPADPDPSDNTDVDFFSVTDTVFSREGGQISGNLSIGGGPSGVAGKLCNKFELVNDDYVSSISAFRTGANIGDTLTAELFDENAGSPNALVASSAITYATSTDADLYTYPFTNAPVFLTAGVYYACINEAAPTSALIGTTDDFNVEGSWVFFNNAWSPIEDFNFFSTFAIRLNMANCEADAGTLTADASPVCLDQGSASISATEATAPNVPNGFEVLYVLTQGTSLLIVDAGATPNFTVNAAGDYTIHTLVYDPLTVNPALLPPGTTGFDVNALLVQGGGTICGALDVAGAPITVEECIVGVNEASLEGGLSIYPNPSNGMFTLEARGFETDAQIVILDVSGRKVFDEGVVLTNGFRKELHLELTKGVYLL
ncbi:MAG: hypothetical protein EP314_06245, partial [Bacteroidetes bacterium]